MSMKYIRKTYGVPAKRGARVRYTGGAHGPVEGTISASDGSYIRVRWDGAHRTAGPYHPTWKMEYLP